MAAILSGLSVLRSNIKVAPNGTDMERWRHGMETLSALMAYGERNQTKGR